MRVIAGEAKGRRLAAIRAPGIRPTADRVREALFSALGPAVAGARVLDLYAGSGALGIEALSRGAALAVFVEQARGAVDVILANLALTGLEDRARVVGSTVERFLDAGRGGPFDLVLIDPPYAEGPPTHQLRSLAAGPLLAPGASVVVEGRGPDAGPPVDGLELVSVRRYGESSLAFLRPGAVDRGPPMTEAPP